MRKRNLFKLKMFKELTPDQQSLLLPLVTTCRIPAGQTVFNQGDPAVKLYILDTGVVDILFKPNDGPELRVAQLTSGGVFGWSSTLGHDTYTSAARTVQNSEAYCFNGTALKKLCVENPATGVVILDRLALAISQRLKVTHAKVMDVLNQGMDLKYNL
jgi:CRP-like cAMP-binding protein